MPPSLHNVSLILFDIKTEAITRALNTLSEIILYKRLSNSKDEFEVYLVNADRSSENMPDGMFYLETSDSMSTILNEIKSIGTGESDWVEVMNVAVGKLMKLAENPGVITLQLLFLTDLLSYETKLNERIINKMTENIRLYDIFLYVVGLDIEPPKIIMSENDIKEWTKKLPLDENNLNIKCMKQIVSNTPNAVICDYDIGVHLFHSFEYCKGSQPWLVELSFAKVFNLPVSTTRMTKREAPFKLKSTSRTEYNDQWVYQDNEAETVELEDIVGGLVKHGKFIRIETDGIFKIDGPRTFSAIGITSSRNIPEYLLHSDCSYLVVPDLNQSEEYLEFFYTLVEELEKSQKYIIARRVYNKGYNPKFAALIPKTNLNIKCFILCELPYADDIAHSYNEKPTEDAPRVEVNKNVSSFLDDIDVNNTKNNIKVPLAPRMMMDINLINIIKKVQEKTILDFPIEERNFGLGLKNEVLTNEIKSEWPARELTEIKGFKESVDNDFDEIGDFSFS